MQALISLAELHFKNRESLNESDLVNFREVLRVNNQLDALDLIKGAKTASDLEKLIVQFYYYT